MYARDMLVSVELEFIVNLRRARTARSMVLQWYASYCELECFPIFFFSFIKKCYISMIVVKNSMY